MIARMTTKTLALTAIALPLALGLASCGTKDDAETALSGEPVAAVAAPEGQEWSEIAEMTDRNGYLVGNPDAPIKLEEFGAFTCGHCAKFTQDAHEELKRDFVDTGRVSYKLTPFMLHPVDAIAVEPAGEQELP